MMYADNVFTAVTEFFKLPIINKNVTYPFKTTRADDEESFFKPTFKKVFPNVPDTGIPCDDKFFKYIRALSFAHPYETSAQPFINQKGGEKHYSPGITVKNSPSFPLKPYTTLSRNTKPNPFHAQRQVAWQNLTLPSQQ